MSSLSVWNAGADQTRQLAQLGRGAFTGGSQRQARRRAQQVRARGGWSTTSGLNQERKYVQKNFLKKLSTGANGKEMFLSYRRARKQGASIWKDNARYQRRRALKGKSTNSRGNTDQSHLTQRRQARDQRRDASLGIKQILQGPRKTLQKSSRHSQGNMTIKYIKRSNYKGRGKFTRF